MSRAINIAAKNLADRRYQPRIVSPKKGKGSYKRNNKKPLDGSLSRG